MILSEAVEVFLDAKLADGIAQTTAGWYRQRLKRLCVFLEDCDLDQIDAMRLRRFVVSLRAEKVLYRHHPYREKTEGKLSPATVQTYVRAVRALFRWLYDEGCMAENLAHKLKPRRLPKNTPKDVDLETIQTLLSATKGDEPGQKRDRALILFLADTGCRVGGLVGLRLVDLDLGEKMAMVTEKGNKTRPVLFLDATAQALREYLETRELDSSWVFPNLKTGAKMLASSVNHILKRVADRADIPGVRCNPHGFRHGFAHRYLVDGGDLASLSEMLGHTDIGVTKHFYSNFQYRELQDKHDRFSQVSQLDLGE